MHKLKFDSILDKLGSNSSRQIFTEMKLELEFNKNLTNKHKHSKTQLNSAGLHHQFGLALENPVHNSKATLSETLDKGCKAERHWGSVPLFCPIICPPFGN